MSDCENHDSKNNSVLSEVLVSAAISVAATATLYCATLATIHISNKRMERKLKKTNPTL